MIKDMSKKLFLLVVFIAATTIAAYAQTTIRGRVLDQTSGEGEPYVTYSIYAGDAQALKAQAGEAKPLKMTITDENGLFTETLNDNGEYVIKFTTLGKKELELQITAKGEPIDLGDIQMEDDEQLLAEASVTALRPLVKMEVDKMTYNIEDDVDSKSMTMLDMLRKVPMVTVDAQDNITVNGSSSFKVYVDGKPNQMLSSNPSKVFKVMPASAFKSAEVITNPGAKYDAEGVGGVLNLITDKSSGQSAVQDGYNGNVELGADTRGSLEGGLFLTAQKGKFSFSTNLSVFNEPMKGIEYTNTLQSLDANGNVASDLTSNATVDSGTPGIFGDLSASYEIDSLRLLTATMDLTHFSGWEGDKMLFTMSTPAAGPLYSYDSDIHSDYKYSSVRAGLDYQRSFAGVEGRALTMSYLFDTNPIHSDVMNDYTDPTGTMTDIHSDSRQNTLEQTAQLDYTTPWGEGGSLSTGAKYISRANTSDADRYLMQSGDWAKDEAGSVKFRHLNSIVAGYGEYSLNREKWGAKAGLRYEHTFQKVKYLSGAGSDFDLDYGNFVPSASVQYNLSEISNIGLSYNLRISRPGISYLNPYVERSIPGQASYGNVDLKTEKSHHIGLVWNFYNPVVMVNLSGRYSFCNNKISQYSFFDSEGILNTTYDNIASQHDIGLNGFINVNIGQKTRIYSNFGGRYVMLDSQTLGLSNSGFQFNTMTGLQHTLPWDLRLSLNYMHNSRTYQLDGYTGGYSGLMSGLTKTFLDDRLTVTLNGVTGFAKGGAIEASQHKKGADYVSSYVTRVPVAMAGLSLSWSFGTSKNVQVKKANRSIENDDILQGGGSGGATGASSVKM